MDPTNSMGSSEDLFTPIHKGLRSLLYQLSGRVQTNDFADISATTVLVGELERDFAIARSTGCAVCVMAAHAQHEERFIFPASDRVGNELVARLILDHHELTRREVAIAAAGHQLLALPTPDDRLAAGTRLNRAMNELLAAYVDHMNREETELVPLMQQHFSDAEMAAMRGAIMGSLPPEQQVAFLRWILPSLNASELAAFLRGTRRALPPPAFSKLTDLCASTVEAARWADVRARVGI